MGVNYEFVRGNSDGIDGKQLKDGQLLFDTERRRISLDTTINGSLSRVNMSAPADNFVGTTEEWEALSSAEKAQYTTVDLTDDVVGYLGSLGRLSDVELSSVTNGQILKYNSTTQKWENGTGGGGGSSTVLSQTLAVGETSVTFSNIPTSGNYLIDFYTSNGANHIGIDTSVSGAVTVSFEVQSVAVTVYCEIREV